MYNKQTIYNEKTKWLMYNVLYTNLKIEKYDTIYLLSSVND